MVASQSFVVTTTACRDSANDFFTAGGSGFLIYAEPEKERAAMKIAENIIFMCLLMAWRQVSTTCMSGWCSAEVYIKLCE